VATDKNSPEESTILVKMFPVEVVLVILFWCLYRNVTVINRCNNIWKLALLRETFNFPAYFRPSGGELYEVILETQIASTNSW